MKIQEFTEKEVVWDMTRVTYKVTLKLSQSFKDKRCEGLLQGCKTETLQKRKKEKQTKVN